MKSFNQKKIKVGIILIFIIILGINSLFSEKFVARMEKPTWRDYHYIRDNEYDVLGFKTKEYLDIVANEEITKELNKLGYSFNKHMTEQALKKNLIVKQGRDIEGYRDYDEMLSELQSLENSYPSLCKLYDIGDSWGKIYAEAGNENYSDYNHEIWALKLSDNVEENEDEPKFYFMGEHHAREPISLEVTMAVLNNLLDNYENDDEIANIINNSQIWFIPLVNPNGHKLVIDQDDLWWRKNVRDNDGDGEIAFFTDDWFYQDGVDPNRNYGFEWGYTGALGSWGAQNYHGPEPWSEPEIQSIKNLLENNHFVAGITYHSSGEWVLYPFGYSETCIAPDKDAISDLAEEMAESIPSLNNGEHYTAQPAWQLYPCMGTTDDYSYGVHGTFSYTIELAQEFIPQASSVETICNDNLEASLLLMDRVNHSTLTGHIYDSETGEPISGEIKIDEIDNEGSFRLPYRSDKEYGRFYRLLPDGNYSITFSSTGYHSKTIHGVDINSEQQTVLEVDLIPIVETVTSTINVIDFTTNEPLENVKLNFPLNPSLDDMYSNEEGIITIEQIPLGNYPIKISKRGYAELSTVLVVNLEENIAEYSLNSSNVESFESGEIPEEWESSGNTEWELSTENPFDGSYCITKQNCELEDKARIAVNMDVAERSQISFSVKTSTVVNSGMLYFLIDNEFVAMYYGNSDWLDVSFEVEPGTHRFEWFFYQFEDSGVNEKVWVDYIRFPQTELIPTFEAPENLILEEIVENEEIQCQLSWTSPSTSQRLLDGYRIYRNYNFLTEVTADQTEYNDINPPVIDEVGTHYYVTAFYNNPDGESNPTNDVIATETTGTSTNNVEKTILLGSYPNPADLSSAERNQMVSINFYLGEKEDVKIDIFNIKGQKLKSITKKDLGKGKHVINWNGKNNQNKKVTSGVYFYRFKTDSVDKTKKILLFK